MAAIKKTSSPNDDTWWPLATYLIPQLFNNQNVCSFRVFWKTSGLEACQFVWIVFIYPALFFFLSFTSCSQEAESDSGVVGKNYPQVLLINFGENFSPPTLLNLNANFRSSVLPLLQPGLRFPSPLSRTKKYTLCGVQRITVCVPRVWFLVRRASRFQLTIQAVCVEWSCLRPEEGSAVKQVWN